LVGWSGWQAGRWAGWWVGSEFNNILLLGNNLFNLEITFELPKFIGHFHIFVTFYSFSIYDCKLIAKI